MKILLILALLLAPAANAAYRCKDENGRTHFGDSPPAACENVVMYEISKSGTVIRRIDPTLTGEQAKAKQEEAARRVEERKAAAEQRRKDIALLSTYGSEKDLDTSRDLNLKPIEGRIKIAQERTVAVEKRQKELEAEMEFYTAGRSSKATGKNREAPPQLVADVERAKHEKVTLARSIEDYRKEMQEIRDRYEVDKKRWQELKRLQSEGKLELRDPAEIEAARKAAASPSPAKSRR